MAVLLSWLATAIPVDLIQLKPLALKWCLGMSRTTYGCPFELASNCSNSKECSKHASGTQVVSLNKYGCF